MKINWKVRAKNPVFWVAVAVAIISPILAYMGKEWTDMTTWKVLGETLFEAVKNPVIIVAIITSVGAVTVDPTTAGISDSTQALTYTKPKESEEADVDKDVEYWFNEEDIEGYEGEFDDYEAEDIDYSDIEEEGAVENGNKEN